MAIKLEKGQRINLEKSNGNKLVNLCVGVNWGAIEKKGFFGGKKMEAVDLDEDFSIETAVEFGRLYKRGGDWKFEAVGVGLKGGLEDYLSKYN